MRLALWLRRLAYPEDAICVHCGSATGGSVLCGECQRDLKVLRIQGACCGRCGHPLGRNGQCEMCARGWQLEGRSVWQHRGIARKLVHQLKFQNRRFAAAALGEGMAEAAADMLRSMDAAVTWVPMPQSRMRERRYDQARLLAEQVAERLELPLVQALDRVEDRGPLRHQVGLNAKERAENLRGTFAPTEECRGVLLLIDDVMTTGATMALASECLLNAGAVRVLTLTATRTLRSEHDEGDDDDV